MNWSEYNKNLVKRGNINLWISEDIEKWWYIEQTRKQGRPFTYSDKAIETFLTISYLFKMPLRMTEGFLNSFFEREGLKIQSPCYTQVSRRAASITVEEIKVARGQNINIAIDSTGVKVFGEGEWKVKIHGTSQKRTWRKLHLGVDTDSSMIIRNTLTKNSVDDASIACDMLASLEGCVGKATGDGAYDKGKVYIAARRAGADLVVPPARNARQQKIIIDPAKLPRDNAIARIRRLGGDEEARKLWKKETGYYRRSLAETAMYRSKITFTDRLRHRKFENQQNERPTGLKSGVSSSVV